jgi:hypothetical protein
MSKVDKFPKPSFIEPSWVTTPAWPGAFCSMDEPCFYYDPYPQRVYVPGKTAGSVSFRTVSEVLPLDLQGQYEDAPQRVPFTTGSGYPVSQIAEAIRTCEPLPQSITVSPSMFAQLRAEILGSEFVMNPTLTIMGVRVISDPRMPPNEIWVNP